MAGPSFITLCFYLTFTLLKPQAQKEHTTVYKNSFSLYLDAANGDGKAE